MSYLAFDDSNVCNRKKNQNYLVLLSSLDLYTSFFFFPKAVRLRIIFREYFWGEGVGVEHEASQDQVSHARIYSQPILLQ